MYEESLLAKNKNEGATSLGSPALFIGTSLPCLATLSLSKLEAINGVQIGPGATAFTLMPRPTNVCERLRVNETIAPFVLA